MGRLGEGYGNVMGDYGKGLGNTYIYLYIDLHPWRFTV